MSNVDIKKPFKLNDVLIDPISNRICHPDETLAAPHKIVALLQYFAARPNTVISNEELTREVWGGFVSEGTRYAQIANLRKLLRDDPAAPRFLKTIPRKGYTLIAEVTAHAEVDTEINVKESPAPKIITEEENYASKQSILDSRIWIYAICAVILIGVLFSLTIENTEHDIDETFKPFALNYPELSVAISATGSEHSKELLDIIATAAVSSTYYLAQNPNINYLFIPSKTPEHFQQKLHDHFHATSPLQYELHFDIVKGDANSLKTSLLQLPGKKVLSENLLELPKKLNSIALEELLPNIQKQIISALQAKQLLTDTTLPVTFTTDERLTLNQAIKLWFDHKLNQYRFDIETVSNELIHLVKGQATENLTSNPILAHLILDYYRVVVYMNGGDYNLESLDTTFENLANKILQHRPSDNKAQATQNLIQCNKKPKLCQITLSEYYSRTINKKNVLPLIDQAYNDEEHTPLALARFRYKLQPFWYNDFAFYDYFSAAVDEKSFDEVQGLVERADFWPTTDGPGLFVRAKTKLERLKQFQSWYQQYLEPQLEKQKEDLSSLALPQGYIAFNLLNANQPELADYWSNLNINNTDEAIRQIEIRILSDLWKGHWQEEKWFGVSAAARSHKNELTTLDKMRLAYLEYHAGLPRFAYEYYQDLAPELFSEKPNVHINNLRFAIYLIETLKDLEKKEEAQPLIHATETFLDQLGEPSTRNVYFGLSDIQFYAQNGQVQKALKRLKKAIEEDQWLPNAFWLWPPLASDPYLDPLYRHPEFKRLAKLQLAPLETLCFEAHCRNTETKSSSQ